MLARTDDRTWLSARFESLTDEMEPMTPSRWAEERRYLPPSVTPLPGPFRFEVAPYTRELLDNFSVDSPIREVACMKGVQLCLTTAVLENIIGYNIDHVKSAPCMLVTADAELAKLRMESYVTPMLQMSGLDHLLKSSDEKNTRKTGKTDKKIEWVGGGFLIPFGAQNANKLRSISIQILLRDEIDGWPLVVGKDGDPISLSGSRCNSYKQSRKILDISTPTVEGMSKIAERFALGDQRYYYVNCLGCGHAQTLRWETNNTETGIVGGIRWQLDADGRLIEDSVRYHCESCGHAHTNDDKMRLLAPENGAEWRPTATPSSPDIRSYHISALYSPVGMQSWAECVKTWLEAWDTAAGRPRDIGKLQVFYNNVLGVPFKVQGEKLRFEQVSAHRRNWYHKGEIPNRAAEKFCGSPVLLLTCAVDVHAEDLSVAVIGWCRDRRPVLVDYERFIGDTEQIDNPATWGRLEHLIDQRVFVADDGKRYRPQLTLIDSGYRQDQVCLFSQRWTAGVFPSKGQQIQSGDHFKVFTTKFGTLAYGIAVDVYKDRWSAGLKQSWHGVGIQPEGLFNAPQDTTDAELKELTVETRRKVIDKLTGKLVAIEWHRPSGAANELWDLLVYNNAALDIVAWDVCRNRFGRPRVVWSEFYEFARGAVGEFHTLEG